MAEKGSVEGRIGWVFVLDAAMAVAPVMIAVPLLVGTQWLPLSACAFVLVGALAVIMLLTNRTFLFGLAAGGLGLASALVLAVVTTRGLAPPIACALCGFGATFMAGPASSFKSAITGTKSHDPDEDEILKKAVNSILISMLTLLGILGASTAVLSLLALNLNLGRFDLASLVLLTAVAIVMATILVLALRPEPKKNVK
ncbi:MAG TPA: hypothetical protein VMS79_04890 [Methanomassiliicoccales archaeon]|nr:hypothetical protein [Methanomassiliicoccales archaeon]